MNRRKVLGGAGLAGAAAATGGGVDRLIISSGTGNNPDEEAPVTMSDDAAHFGDPRIPAESITWRLGSSSMETETTRASNSRSMIWFSRAGVFHYFENRGEDDLTIITIQNTSAPEDNGNIGIGESLSRLPPRVLSAVFGAPAETFTSFKKIDNSIVILRSP